MEIYGFFKEVDICGSYDGRIMAASVNARTGLIVFQKESQVKKTINCCSEDFTEDDFNFENFSSKMSIFGQHEWRHRKGEQKKPRRYNRKTMPDRKVQRASRNLLGQLKTFCADEEYFYEALDALNDGLFSFMFSSMEFSNEDFADKACA